MSILQKLFGTKKSKESCCSEGVCEEGKTVCEQNVDDILEMASEATANAEAKEEEHSCEGGACSHGEASEKTCCKDGMGECCNEGDEGCNCFH